MIAINGISTKNGTGSLLENLNHDSVTFHEKAVMYALESLWDMADNNEMKEEELQEKLLEISNWISDIERNSRKLQPTWSNYF